MTNPEIALVKKLYEKKLTLAIAESMTCGFAAHRLGGVKNVSDVFRGSIVCYHESAKIKLLGISKKLIEKHSAESVKITEQLAVKLPSLIAADIYAAVTGLASPGGSETKSKPVGTVFFSMYFRNKKYNTRKNFRGTPLEIKTQACRSFFRFILINLEK